MVLIGTWCVVLMLAMVLRAILAEVAWLNRLGAELAAGARVGGLPAGAAIPEFVARDVISNEVVTSRALAGHHSIVMFVFQEYGDSDELLKSIGALSCKSEGHLFLVCSSTTEDKEAALIRAVSTRLSYVPTLRILLDRDGRVAAAFRIAVSRSPTAVYVDPGARVIKYGKQLSASERQKRFQNTPRESIA